MITPSLRTLALALLTTVAAHAVTYEVGLAVGQMPNLSNVPWGTLQPGDTVNIHPKPGGYHEIIQVSAAGTAAAPILIRGIPDANGTLPVIDGDGAVMDPHVDFRNPVFENFGVIIVTPRTKGYIYGKTFPAYITLESLDIRNALYDATGARHFTDQHGATRIYDTFACGIYIEFAQHLTVRGCEISFNGNGIFANSKNGPAQSSSDLLIEKNYIHDNGQPSIAGLTNGYHEHNIYIESVGAVYQYNRFGPLRAACHGCMIKDRSSGCIIRYNEVVSTEASEMFAILDPQGGSGYIDQQTDYRDAFVYGNVITLQSAGFGGANIVWFAACNGASSYPTQHRGTLHFYHNTVVNHQPTTGAFFLTDTAYTGASPIFEQVDARNNIFYSDTAIQNNIYQAFHFGVTNAAATINLGLNWVSPLTQAGWINHSPNLIVNGWANLVVGDYLGKNNPAFAAPAALDYNLTTGSDAIDLAGPLSAAALAKGLTVDQQYVSPQSFAARPVLGANSDLGAFETSAQYVPPAINHAPFAYAQSLNLIGPAPVSFALAASDVDGDPLTYSVTGLPARGTIAGAAPNLTYTPVTGGGTVGLSFVANDGQQNSPTAYVFIAFNDAGSTPPSVALTSPAVNTVLGAPASLTISATASDADGIKRVDFFAGSTIIGSKTTAPYTFTWSNVAPGTYHIVAKATDNLENRTFSTPVTVTVK